MRRNFALVFNERAGLARPKLLDRVLSCLNASGADVVQLAAASAEEATARVRGLAAQGGADAVIAAGGDGTFRAVATGAAGSTLPVGFIPLGTGNVLAYEIGIAKRGVPLAEGLLNDPAIDVQGGLINGAPFFLMTGAGYDARIIAGLDYGTKRAFARAAYTAPVLKTLAQGTDLFDVEVDGRAFAASWAIVTRASHYGGSFVLTRETQLGVAPMIAIIVEGRSRRALLSASIALGLGRLGTAKTCPKGVRVLAARRVHIGLANRVSLQVDGDEAGMSPAVVEADGPVVKLIVPPSYVADLTNRHTNHLPSVP